MRYFLSTGEPSGELNAALLARAIKRLDPQAEFEGIGAARLREAGARVVTDTSGWATMGLLQAIPRIPKLVVAGLSIALRLRRDPPDALVLFDFGAFHLRLATLLRRIGYRKPIVDVFTPATWLDDESRARAVSRVAIPVTAFARQREFYERLQLPIAYFGHPLRARYERRAPRPAPPPDGGTIAVLPGSRAWELRFHLPALAQAYASIKAERPNARAVFGAADDRAERAIRRAIAQYGIPDATIVRGLERAIADADAAWVASGTAVLETALSGVPSVALYVMAPAMWRHARRAYRGPFVTLPNLILESEIVPELLQDDATPQALAAAMEALLRDPQAQLRELEPLADALGPRDALEQIAAFTVAVAKDGRR